MTISLSDAARALIEALLDSRHGFLSEELQTVTGYYESEYRQLHERLADRAYMPTEDDLNMIGQAANNLLGYPLVDEAACVELIGEHWKLVATSLLPSFAPGKGLHWGSVISTVVA